MFVFRLSFFFGSFEMLVLVAICKLLFVLMPLWLLASGLGGLFHVEYHFFSIFTLL